MRKFDGGMFRARVAELAEEAGSLRKLGEHTGVPGRTIEKWKQGPSVPKIDTAADFSIASNVTIDWLAGLSDERNSSAQVLDVTTEQFVVIAQELLKDIAEAAGDENIKLDPEHLAETFADILRYRLTEEEDQNALSNIIRFSARKVPQR